MEKLKDSFMNIDPEPPDNFFERMKQRRFWVFLFLLNLAAGCIGLFWGGENSAAHQILWMKNYHALYVLPFVLLLPLALVLLRMDKSRVPCLICALAMAALTPVCLLGTLALVNRSFDHSAPSCLAGEIRGIVLNQERVICDFPGNPELMLKISRPDYLKLRKINRPLVNPAGNYSAWVVLPRPKMALTVKPGFLGLKWQADPLYRLED